VSAQVCGDGLGVDAGDLVTVVDVDEDLSVAIGLGKAEPAGHEDLG
jgi:hypothetical protein